MSWRELASRVPSSPQGGRSSKRRWLLDAPLSRGMTIGAVLLAPLLPRPRRNPARRAPLRLRADEPRHQGDAGRRHVEPRDALGARRRSAVEAKGGARGQVLRGLPWRCRAPRCAASRRAIRRSARDSDRPIDIEQRINLCRTETAGGAAVRLREPRPAGAHRLSRAAVARDADRDSRTTRRPSRSSRRAASSTRRARASSISPARTAMTTTGARSSPACRWCRATRPATRSTASNGRASARCSAACATA